MKPQIYIENIKRQKKLSELGGGCVCRLSIGGGVSTPPRGCVKIFLLPRRKFISITLLEILDKLIKPMDTKSCAMGLQKGYKLYMTDKKTVFVTME